MADEKSCAKRVARLRELMEDRGYDAVVLRNNPDLRWLTGCERTFDDETAHTVVITADRQMLHTDSRYYNTFCERLGPDTAWELDESPVTGELWAAARVVAARARVVAVQGTCTLAFYDEFKHQLAAHSVAPATPRLHGDLVSIRAVKDAEEIDLMRQAQKITDDAFTHICGYIKPGMTEQEIRAELENYMLSNGASALSFGSIIASGPNGANPHAQPGPRPVQEGDMIVMDYGCCVADYHSDMTRTVCLGEPSEEQRHVYDVVRRAHEECAAMAHAGVIGKDVYDHSVKVISDAGYGDYYKHGLGHGVGVEIHEQPNFNRRNLDPIPAGAVITIEPGIYLPGKFGIRLEDFGVVTEDGYEPFTESTHDLVVIPC